MKRIVFLSLLIMSFFSVAAQTDIDTIPPYKKDPHIPSFKLMQFDNSFLTNNNLPKNRSTVIIYFSPDCDHCKHEAKEITKNMDKFKNVNFVWASYKMIFDIKEFARIYEFSKYPNMFIGRDPEYKLPTFYRVKFTPFVAVYNKKGLFVKAFEQGAEVSELLPLLKKN